MAEAPGQDESRFLTFRLGGRLYALPAAEVSEVIRVPHIARLPQGPRALMGLGNLRGVVLPIASGRGLLGQEEAQPGRAIVLAGPAPVGIAVDRVEGLVAVGTSRIARKEAELAAEEGERLTGAFQLGRGGEVAKILDVRPMLEVAFVQAPRSPRATMPVRQHPTASDVAMESVSERLVTFDVAGQEFALPLEEVQEIVPAPDGVTSVPRADGVVIGVAAYRDTLLPLLSLRSLLGMAGPSASGERAKVLVVAFGPTLAGLLVERVRAIVQASSDEIEPTPAVLALRASGESRIRAIYRGQGGRRLISILSRDELFREDVVQRLASAAALAATSSQTREAPRAEEFKFLVFRLADEEFGLPIEAVDEVARVPSSMARVPKTPRFLEGVINLRGEVLPVVDQRRRFDLPPAPNPDARRLIVVRTADQRAGLIVDSVSEVLRSTADEVEPAPDLTGESNRLVSGVINLDSAGRLVLLLDPAELLTRAERGLLEAFQSEADRDST